MKTTITVPVEVHIEVEQDEDGVFVATSTGTLPGLVAQGKTDEEVREDARHAAVGMLTSLIGQYRGAWLALTDAQRAELAAHRPRRR
jgi:predicted RNase H-like HicB family nuclease